VRDRKNSVKAPEQGTNVLFDVWRVSRATSGALDRALAPTGLSADEFGLYSVLSSAPSMTPGEVARWMAAPPTTVSSYVKRLESRGHLERSRNPADGRSYVLRLTAEGRAAHQAAGNAFLPVLAQVEAELGQHEPAVRDALALLLGALSDEAGRSV
jgi:DNA-binding MarR family transcriptional regulator